MVSFTARYPDRGQIEINQDSMYSAVITVAYHEVMGTDIIMMENAFFADEREMVCYSEETVKMRYTRRELGEPRTMSRKACLKSSRCNFRSHQDVSEAPLH